MSAALNPRKRKVSRITTACNPCRSRKQKCSGKRPICEQCLECSRACTWPEQLKRGPAKGYVEALEQRLRETEGVLLTMLSQLTHAQLSSILSTQNSLLRPTRFRPKPEHQTPMLLPSRERAVDYWKSFPLSDLESIQRWQRDRYRCRSRPGPSQDEDLMNVYVSSDESRTRPLSPGGDTSTLKSERIQRPTASVRPNSVSDEVDTEPESSPLRVPSDFHDHTYDFRPSSPPTHQDKLNTPKDFSSWEAAPSIRFQKKFLW